METSEEIKQEKQDCEEIEQEYEILKLKYNLPDFKQLTDDFDIEKIAEKPSSYLLRETRRMINEKLSAYMHLLETLLNPSSPPMFIFTILKNLTENDKELIKDIYKKLAKLQIESIKLDTIYKEENEAKFLIKSSEVWNELKQKSYNLFEQFENKFEENNGAKTKGYFG